MGFDDLIIVQHFVDDLALGVLTEVGGWINVSGFGDTAFGCGR
jgi:hypothetical protein